MQVFTDDNEAHLLATVLPETATNKNIVWTSSDTLVATVVNGKITPLKAGTTTITATSQKNSSKFSRCTITVKDPVNVQNYVMRGLYDYETTTWTDKQMVINPEKTSEYMLLGVRLYDLDEFKIHMIGDAWYGYSNIKTNAGINFNLFEQSSRDDNIIIKYGMGGYYDIYCDYNYDYSGRGNIYITKSNESGSVSVKSVVLDHSGLYLKGREEKVLTANVLPANASNKSVTWTSSDTSIATVTSAGRVVANLSGNTGTTTITARTQDGGYTSTCLVYVTNAMVPDYYLTGTISGYYRHSYTSFPAIPVSTKHYLFPDVQLMEGDVIYVTARNGARIRVNTSVYEYIVRDNMTANVYLDMTKMKDYLSFEPRSN